MSGYDTSGSAPLSQHQFRGMVAVPAGEQYGGVRAVENSSGSGGQTVTTLATTDQAARKSSM